MKMNLENSKKDTVKNLLKKVWVKRLGLVVCGIVLANILFNPFEKAKEIDNLSAKNEGLTIDYDNLEEDYNKIKKDYDTLTKDTAAWSKLTEEEQKAALDKVEADRKKAEAEAKAKEEAERIAAEQKALQEEAKENQAAETSQSLTEAQVKEMLEYYSIGENDKLVNFSFIDGEIKATIDLAQNELISDKDMAVNRYTQLSDELLNHEGWQILTIAYSNIGTISMNRNEKESNEFGDYFPTMEIEDRLN